MSDPDLLAENAELKRNLQDKVKQLIQRERDVHTLLRRLHETYRWMGSIAELASRVAAARTIDEALSHLAETLVVVLDYDLAVATWGGHKVEVPEIDEAIARAHIQTLLLASEHESVSPEAPQATRHLFDDSALLVDAWRLYIGSVQNPSDKVTLIVGRGARTARFRHTDEDTVRQRLDRLAAVMVHGFDAVRLKLDLVRERDQLQGRVEEATRELRGALVVAEEARREAENAARVRGEFLANMSHEIRTPMTAVLGYADLLLGPNVTREQELHWVETIRRSGSHLLQILDDILDLARLESGRFTLAPEPASLGTVLHDVLSMLNVRAAEKGLELRLEFATPLPKQARFDASRMRQILINLVGNALKFTHTGVVRIIASCHEDPAVHGASPHERGRVCFEVAVDDTGIGVPEDKRALIFEAFEQGSTGIGRRHSGTGLGLAISRRLARMMDGDIALVPKDGPGSRFIASIRAEVVGVEAWSVAANAVEHSHPIQVEPTGARGHILVVEDTPLIQKIMQIVLSDAGHIVTLVPSGVEALEHFQRGERVDLVLMDMQMPGLDGYETTRRLRQAGQRIPIIALTAHAMAGDRDLCLASGCNDYLAKPVERSVLLATVTRHLELAGGV